MNQTQIDNLAQIIWDYMLIHHALEKADCVLVLGSHDTRVADYAAGLFLQKYAPYILFSGGLGRLTEGVWNQPEARIFADIAKSRGVPKEKILIEDRSTNTGENIRFSSELLLQKNLHFKKFIVIQKPYMERRSYATFKKQWPDEKAKIIVTSPPLTFQQYCNRNYPKNKVIAIMLGDLERIKTYPEKGFQIYQEIPDKVWQAYLELLPHFQ